ncbi:MAG: 2Fe-2S iron-sulfur cluster binding domain-containing protein [Rhodospirillaceae bacterium]|nr:2Fe-2S iron-sulfur cluster binding domain-containing protein [Rhodospirillaceae bacterium]
MIRRNIDFLLTPQFEHVDCPNHRRRAPAAQKTANKGTKARGGGSNVKALAVQSEPRYEVTVAETGESYLCSPHSHLLGAMVALGRKGIPSGCHGGGCGVCKVRVVAGDYSTLPMSRAHISPDEEQQGIVLACRTFPLADLRLEVVGKLKKAVTRKKFGLV